MCSGKLASAEPLGAWGRALSSDSTLVRRRAASASKSTSWSTSWAPATMEQRLCAGPATGGSRWRCNNASARRPAKPVSNSNAPRLGSSQGTVQTSVGVKETAVQKVMVQVKDAVITMSAKGRSKVWPLCGSAATELRPRATASQSGAADKASLVAPRMHETSALPAASVSATRSSATVASSAILPSFATAPSSATQCFRRDASSRLANVAMCV
mmetsp:Transcript_15309/g.47166  ORF Transcript_15309/g.47166 Transcript_15309/m.47166 type:complete len:214 (+) Transcript_15309:427-1068(+)